MRTAMLCTHRLLQQPLAAPDCLQPPALCAAVLLHQLLQPLVRLLLPVTHCMQSAGVCGHSVNPCLDLQRASNTPCRLLLHYKVLCYAE
jgi:hypothetical protein